MEHLPETIKSMVSWSYIQVFQPILNASEGKRMCWAIGAVNCAVFLAWRVPRWNAFMMRSFTHNPLSGRSYTLLTSTFSHEGFIHLAFNCMALASFGAAAGQQLILLTKKVEQERGVLSEPSPKWHLLALFVSAGLFAGLVSHVAYARWNYPRMIARLKAATPSPSVLRSSSSAAAGASAASEATIVSAKKAATDGQYSLGSSGAIYAMFAITALGFPDAEITLIIPPWFPINIQTGFAAIVALDVLGVLRGWKMLDHYAHLGGAAFGAFWFAYGAQIWFAIREWNLPVAYFFHGHALKKAKESTSA
ncbi:Presenilins-associated rhomboid-like protein, mitochondrial [Trametes pubescens]|uniref:Presenilins-associated rhomboid-like protein, mitochondrial n=1 Tax=Trametes pubescens TaxID=154538 RepID=A0A1M2VHX1_TRAPU|nr:Presenilins-associated rhomboid-like protein, mitochondrial [Trametes pubescens]